MQAREGAVGRSAVQKCGARGSDGPTKRSIHTTTASLAATDVAQKTETPRLVALQVGRQRWSRAHEKCMIALGWMRRPGNVAVSQQKAIQRREWEEACSALASNDDPGSPLSVRVRAQTGSTGEGRWDPKQRFARGLPQRLCYCTLLAAPLVSKSNDGVVADAGMTASLA